jgi:hypothetical protein
MKSLVNFPELLVNVVEFFRHYRESLIDLNFQTIDRTRPVPPTRSHGALKRLDAFLKACHDDLLPLELRQPQPGSGTKAQRRRRGPAASDWRRVGARAG